MKSGEDGIGDVYRGYGCKWGYTLVLIPLATRTRLALLRCVSMVWDAEHGIWRSWIEMKLYI